MKVKFILLAGILLLFSNGLFGEEIHVSDVKTIEEAANSAKAGDTVIIKDGAYVIPKMIVIRNSGDAQNPITFQAEHSRKVILDSPSIEESNKGFTPIKVRGSFIVLKGLVARRGGFKVDKSDVTVEDCEAYDNGPIGKEGEHIHTGSGIIGSGDRLLVTRCDFHGNYEHAIYISGGADEVKIIDNILHDNHTSDLQFNNQGDKKGGCSERCVVRGNLIYNTIGGLGGMNLMSLSDSVVENNIVYEDGKGISLGRSTPGIASKNNLIVHNTVVTKGWGTISITSPEATGNKIYNNILVKEPPGKSMPIIIHSEKFTDFESDYNVIWNGALDQIAQDDKGEKKWTLGDWKALGRDTHSKNADPKFVDAANHNYHLLPDSPAIGLAVQNYGATGASSGPNDAGAYQHTSPSH